MKPDLIKGEIPFVRLLIPFAGGLAVAIFLPEYRPCFYYLQLVSLILVSLFFFSVILFARLKIYRYSWLPGFFSHLLLFIGAFVLAIEKSQLADPHFFAKNKPEALIISVSSEPRLSNNILRFEARIIQGYRNKGFERLSGNLLIAMKAGFPAMRIRYGDRLVIPALFNEIEPPHNPNEYDYKNYLANHGIYYQAFINQDQVHNVAFNGNARLIRYAFDLRKNLIARYSVYIHDPEALSVASTLILGYRADLSSDVLNAYSKTGTMHVLSVSGMHVGIVFIVLDFLLKFMDRTKLLRLLRAILVIALIWFYSVLTGFSPAVCRAAMMLSFIVLGKAINRNSNTYNIIAASAFILLFYDPFFLADVGFQLSYLAVLGLVYFYPGLYKIIYVKNYALNKLWEALALSTAAQLATFPLSIFYFHQFPVYFLLSNLFIILPVAFIMYAGLLYLFIPWDFLLKPVGWVLEKAILITNKGLFMIENLPFSNLEGLWIPAWYYLLIYFFIALVIFSWSYRNKYLIYVIFMLLFVFSGYHAVTEIDRERQQKLIFYSLYRNTAIGIFNGKTATLLSDMDSNDKTFIFSVKPSLDVLSSTKKLINLNRKGPDSYSYKSIQFKNQKILLWDRTFNNRTFKGKLVIDMVMLRANPEIRIRELCNSVKFGLLLIDGTNPDYKIKRWKEEASALNCKFYVLKGNKALIIE